MQFKNPGDRYIHWNMWLIGCVFGISRQWSTWSRLTGDECTYSSQCHTKSWDLWRVHQEWSGLPIWRGFSPHRLFFYSVVVFPERFGAGQCSDDSFECFIHMWRVIGYYLGVEDRFNAVRSTLSETRKLHCCLKSAMSLFYIPSVIQMNTTRSFIHHSSHGQMCD